MEWRQLASKLQFSRGQGGKYLDPPFFNHVVGLGLEWDDPGNAYVAMRLAEAGYLEAERTPPADLVGDLVRLASALGFPTTWTPTATLRSPCHLAAGRAADGGRPAAAAEDEWGEIVILVEEGLIAPIHETRVYIPIIEALEAGPGRGEGSAARACRAAGLRVRRRGV